jgi:hypothetical protein
LKNGTIARADSVALIVTSHGYKELPLGQVVE